MGITKLGSNQELTRHATWTTPNFGEIKLSAMGEISDTVSAAPLITGQTRPSGQTQSGDVSCSIPMEHREDVVKVQTMKAMAKAGAKGYLMEGSTMAYEKVDGLPGYTQVLDECWVHTFTIPATDANATGDGALVTFTITVWGSDQLPGS